MALLRSQTNTSEINVKTANRALLAFLLLPILSGVSWSLPDNFSFLGFALINLIGIALLFWKALQEFIQEKRFQTLPRWTSIIIITGIVLAINFGTLLFIAESVSFFSPHLSKVLEQQENSLDLGEFSGFSILRISTILLAGAVIVPLYEEFLFRGLVLKAYERAKSPLFASTITAVLFASLHLSLMRLIAFVPSFFLVAVAVQRKRSWWLAVIAHTVNNAIAFGLEFWDQGGLETTKPDGDLAIGLFGLAIAIIAFFLGANWLRIFSLETSKSLERSERILTPSLTIVVLIVSGGLLFQFYNLISSR
jgi:membrane protease YdiL (CAAX protease family)